MNEELNKELCGLLGIQWHEPEWMVEKRMWTCLCGIWTTGIPPCADTNPDFTSDSGKIALLREMMKRDDWGKFNKYLLSRYGAEMSGTSSIFIPCYYMTDDKGAFAIAARDFLKGKQK